jgi:peroxiredoxin Q/BCP
MLGAGLVVVVAVAVLYAVYASAQRGTTSRAGADGKDGGSGYAHAAGAPGAGAAAPGFTLASSRGGQVSLASFRGKSVLLYFQEGLTCQPCWDQLRDLEHNTAALRAAGVDTVVSITTDPVGLLTQKVADQKLSTPVLSDPTLAASRAYHANQYGMMGDMRDGHSFVLVGPDGIIRWRADYGGSPDYTMYLPTQRLLADLTSERTP